jgi:hypothetical protein
MDEVKKFFESLERDVIFSINFPQVKKRSYTPKRSAQPDNLHKIVPKKCTPASVKKTSGFI